ncbi:hypothetical protein Bhyg_11579 [Pseudolycoriella hygida]|uniref:Uncharacterized protein n=1 Tax=Pseudolycoriella hygida TaxID=35572 RepID=A0A9Q0MVT9_9DIPT|nr:hypothetical protein Bhyg_11579 [Pseudolycoriella hygida]
MANDFKAMTGVNTMVANAKADFLRKRLDASIGMKKLWNNAKSLELASSNSYLPVPSVTRLS